LTQLANQGEKAANIAPDDTTFQIKTTPNPSNLLAQYVHVHLNSSSIASPSSAANAEPCVVMSTEPADDEPAVPVQPADNLSRQLCRQWLKHKYLGSGSICLDVSEGVGACGRMHRVPANIGHLYSDYSFKGLSKVQRKSIMDAVRQEQSHMVSGLPYNEDFRTGEDNSELSTKKRSIDDGHSGGSFRKKNK
jgi:hypothetical protein